MSNILDIPQNFSTTLNVGGGINNSQTAGITLTSVTGLPTDGGILAFDWASPINTSTIEYIEYGSLSSNDLAGVVRGQEGYTAKTHTNGCTIVGVVSRQHIKRLKDNFTVEHDRSSGVHTNMSVATFTQQSTPSNPASSKNSLYFKSDNKLYSLTNGGVEAAINTASTDGWTADTNTWTYSSVDGATGVVTINADLTGIIQAGDRIKFTQTTVKYFIVTKTPTFATGSTTLTFWGGTDYTLANATITSPSYSHTKNPFGFNIDPTKWTIRVTDTSDRSQAPPTNGTWYNLGTTAEQITIHTGLWDVYYAVALQIDVAGAAGVFVTLSTANNTESDPELTANVQSAGSFSGQSSVTRRKTFSVSSKATYFLNSKTTAGSATTLYNRNSSSGSPLIIEARCAYL